MGVAAWQAALPRVRPGSTQAPAGISGLDRSSLAPASGRARGESHLNTGFSSTSGRHYVEGDTILHQNAVLEPELPAEEQLDASEWWQAEPEEEPEDLQTVMADAFEESECS